MSDGTKITEFPAATIADMVPELVLLGVDPTEAVVANRTKQIPKNVVLEAFTGATAVLSSGDTATTAQAKLTANTRVLVLPGTITLASTVTVPAGCTLVFVGGVIDQTAGTFTFARAAKIDAADTAQCFTHTSVVTFEYDTIASVYAAWFGLATNATGAVNKAALLTAMNALGLSTLASGTVICPRGVFDFAGDLVFPYPGIKLVSQGWAGAYNDSTQLGTMFRASAGTRGFDLRGAFGVGAFTFNDYACIEGIRLDGNAIWDYGIDIQGTKVMRGVIVTGCNIEGVFLRDYINQTILDNVHCVGNHGNGCTIAGALSTDYVARNCSFRLNTLVGFRVRSGLNFACENNTYEANGQQGIQILGTVGSSLGYGVFDGFWIEANNTAGGTYAISVDSTASAIVGLQFLNGKISADVGGTKALDIKAAATGLFFKNVRFGAAGTVTIASGANPVFEDCPGIEAAASTTSRYAVIRDKVSADRRTNTVAKLVSTGQYPTTFSLPAGQAMTFTVENAAAGFTILITDDSAGNSGFFQADFGGTFKIRGAASFVATAPGASEIGVTKTGAVVSIANGFAGARVVSVQVFGAAVSDITNPA